MKIQRGALCIPVNTVGTQATYPSRVGVGWGRVKGYTHDWIALICSHE